MKRKLLLALLALALLGGGGAGFLAFRAHAMKRQITLRDQALQRALAHGHGRDALALVEDVRREAAGRATETQQDEWRHAELTASVEARDARRILALYARDPALVEGDEGASLLAARALSGAGKTEAATALRAAWKGKEKQAPAWLAYDADLMIRNGDNAEAIALLEGAKFTGEDDCLRLLRLAVLHERNPEKALGYLREAYAADPRNADLRTYRGQLLERAGEATRARVEYVAALVTAPANPVLRDQLAEFYLRQREYPLALQTFAEGQAQPGGDAHHFRALFWGLMTTPNKLTTTTAATPGALDGLSALLEKLPAGQYWNETAFSQLSTAHALERTRQEIFWLRLLQQLSTGEEKEAADTLATDHFRQALFEPELAQALEVVLAWRLQGIPPVLASFGPARGRRQPFLEQLVAWSKGQAAPGLEEFVAGPNAFSAAFLSFGWIEPAVRLARVEKGLGEAPEWYRYGIVQAVRINRGPAAALALAHTAPASPLLTGLIGEMELGLGHEKAALAALGAVAADDSDAGYRAAWLLATRALERKDFAGARAFIQGQGRLLASVTGREMLARLAAREGHPDEAGALYTALAETSLEAQSFLAQRAFATKNWPEARRLTEQMIEQQPDEMQLRRNLELIEQAAR